MRGGVRPETFIFSIVQAEESSRVPTQTIEEIVDLVNNYCQNGQIYGPGATGICNALQSKLENAIDARDRGQPDVACNMLNAFINQVEAKKDKQPNGIEADAADTLINAANEACNALTASPAPTETPQNQETSIEEIVDLVNNYCQNGQIYGPGATGICNSLGSKLENAIDARDRGQPDVACNMLNAFINQVEAKKDKQPNGIEADAADTLINAANEACSALSPTPTETPQNQETSIENIVDLVNNYCENGQIYELSAYPSPSGVPALCNSLLSKLENAIQARDQGEPHMACNILSQFIDEVEAKREQQPSGIEADAADTLMNAANEVCNILIASPTPLPSATPDPNQSPTPLPTSTPTATLGPPEPTQTPQTQGVSITVWEGIDPTDPRYADHEPEEGVTVEFTTESRDPSQEIPVQQQAITTTREFEDKASTERATSQIEERGDDIIGNWERFMTEDFEDGTLHQRCRLRYKDGHLKVTWGADDFNAYRSNLGAWPAITGQDHVDPQSNPYPANLYSILVCGPFDRANFQKMTVRYLRWLKILDEKDYFKFGYSTDGNEYNFLNYQGVRNWTNSEFRLNLTPGVDGDIWFRWEFTSDDMHDHPADGAWIDNIEIWRYNRPAQTCGDLDPGNKGIVLPPYQSVGNREYPIIRPGYHVVLDQLIDSDVDWVRLGFESKDQGLVSLQEYDYMVDLLCENGISVLGLVNHQTLTGREHQINDPDVAVDYRLTFGNRVKHVTRHYKDSITYWEVWNEQNYDPLPGPESDPPYVQPSLYAPLLGATAERIKESNPNAQILFGGLASAWGDSHEYFEEVYRFLGNTSAPVDYFAIHPYFDNIHGLDPEYLRVEHGTILAKFLKTMNNRGDGHKKIWITEIGWNSAKGQPNLACGWESLVVYEEPQAEYLTKSFDILFNEVNQWWNNNCPAVDKVIWYQHFDVSIPKEVLCPGEQVGAMSWKGKVPAGNSLRANSNHLANVPWSFGLYRGDYLTAKPSQCAFAAYPSSCGPIPTGNKIYLPFVSRSQRSCP